MEYTEAKEIIRYHALEGIAYTSRFGEYPNRNELCKLISALETVSIYVSNSETIERELASWVFTISDQALGNFNCAAIRDIELKTDLTESDLFQINELAYAIFEK